ncbi:MAG: Zn-dependent hydrolase [Bacteroidales bacterium]|nr:Zn-dependent hydrolase [Bacteroidales bacterium]
MKFKVLLTGIITCIMTCTFMNCQNKKVQQEEDVLADSENIHYFEGMYVPFKLTTDLSTLSENERKMIPLLINAAGIMDELFWFETYGDMKELLARTDDKKLIEFIKINYGPWDRLNNNKPFIDGIGEKPPGANFYPVDMTKSEFESLSIDNKASLYTFLRRNDEGKIITIPYHEQFARQHGIAAGLLQQAASLAESDGLKKYLQLRAEALLTDEYRASDMAWLDMKDNTLDIVIGPVETYEDRLFGYKAAHEAFVLVKDKTWSDRLARYASFLPELQKDLPVPDEYKQETPGADADLNVYDVIFYAGDCNAGSKTIAINLPNDEEVQLKKGTRKLQLKNAMQAKFDKILIPIADELIHLDQKGLINFNAFFSNTMFHEIAHGMGIKNTVNGSGTVRRALQDHASTLEESKADILGFYLITELSKKGEIDGDLEEYYTTFLAGIFRSVRFGASSAHGKANMIRFNFFKQMNAFERDDTEGTYRVNFENMEKAVEALSRKVLILQGNGDYDSVDKFVKELGIMDGQLQSDLDRLNDADIPVDIIFEQGFDVLGIKN